MWKWVSHVVFQVVWCELKVVKNDRSNVVVVVVGGVVWEVGVFVGVSKLALGSFAAFSIGEEHAQQVFAGYCFCGSFPVVGAPVVVVVDVFR